MPPGPGTKRLRGRLRPEGPTPVPAPRTANRPRRSGPSTGRPLVGRVVGLLLVVLPVVAGQAPVTSEAHLPSGRAATTAVWYPGDPTSAHCPSGCGFIFGGVNQRGDALADIVRFRPDLDQAGFANGVLPQAHYLGTAVWQGSFAFVFGGLRSGIPLDTIVHYDPATDGVGTASARLPHARYAMSGVWTGRYAFLFGGDGGVPVDQVLRYDPEADRVDPAPIPLPLRVRGTSAVWDGRHAYIFGGHDGNAYRDGIVRFDPRTNESRILLARLPSGRSDTAAAWDGEYAYVIGGYDGAAYVNEVIRFHPPTETISVQRGSSLPTGRTGPSVVWNGTQLLVFGGHDDATYSDEILRITPPASSGPMPGGTKSPAGTAPTQPGERPGSRVLWEQRGLLLGVLAAAVVVPLLLFTGSRVLRRRPARAIAALPPTGPGAPRLRAGPAPLVTRDLRVRLGGRTIVDGVSLEVPRGALTFLLGASGSGKSTLLRAIVGLVASTGEIEIDRLPHGPANLLAKRRLGFVPQELQLYENLDAIENVVYFGRQFELPPDEARSRARSLLAALGLADDERHRLSRLSGGQRRRVSIAAALVHEPGLLVLDEPTSGLDFSSRKALWGIIQRLARTRGVGVLATTHFIDDVQYGDRVGILDHGRLLALGAPRELIQSLPGHGRCVEIEFDEFSPEDRRRLEALAPVLRQRAGVERSEYRTFSVRFFSRDPTSTARVAPDELFRRGFRVRATRLDDVTLEDVFVYHTGRPPAEVGP